MEHYGRVWLDGKVLKYVYISNMMKMGKILEDKKVPK